MFPAALSGASRGRLRRDGSPARLGLGLRLGWHGERHRPLLRTVWSTSRGWHATAKSRSIRCGVIVPERWSRPNQALRAAPPRRSFARFVLGGASSDLERSVRPSLTPLLLVLHRQRLQCRRGGNLRMSRPADAEIRPRVDRCGVRLVADCARRCRLVARTRRTGPATLLAMPEPRTGAFRVLLTPECRLSRRSETLGRRSVPRWRGTEGATPRPRRRSVSRNAAAGSVIARLWWRCCPERRGCLVPARRGAAVR